MRDTPTRAREDEGRAPARNLRGVQAVAAEMFGEARRPLRGALQPI